MFYLIHYASDWHLPDEKRAEYRAWKKANWKVLRGVTLEFKTKAEAEAALPMIQALTPIPMAVAEAFNCI